MSGWAAKRFWTSTSVHEVEGGFTVQLDARAVKTPAKAPLIVPTRAMAEAIAAEWDAQSGKVNPETMPFTRAANSSIDKIIPLLEAVVDEVAGFGASDLLCYRAVTPEELVARQEMAWDPILRWAAEDLGATLTVTRGIMHVEQPAESLVVLRGLVKGHSPFQLMALHDLVAITGSLVLGLAVARNRLSPEEGFALSRIDELWQIEHWGEDEDAAKIESLKQLAFKNAAKFFALCG